MELNTNTAIHGEQSIYSNEDISIPPERYAAIYARKSMKTESHSIESQIALAKELLYEKNLILYNVYFDSESAYKYTYDKRSGFSELVSDLNKGKFKTIITLKRDRLSRRFNELLQIKDLFRKNNIKVIYSASGEFQSNEDNPYSDFVENILMAISELEPNIVNERTSTGRIIKREKGVYSKGRNVPFGFAINEGPYSDRYDSDFILVPHDYEAPIAKSIIEEYINSTYSIKNFISFAKKINTTENELSDEQIKYMLTNPIYAGFQRSLEVDTLFEKDPSTNKYNLKDENLRTMNNVKPIIDKDTFISVSLKYLNNKRHYSPRKITYLYKNMLVCSRCNKNVTLSGKYYGCTSKKCTRIKDKLLITTITKQVLNDIFTDERANEIVLQRVSSYKSEHAKLNNQLLRVKKEKQESLYSYINNLSNKSIKADTENKLNDTIKAENSLMDNISELEDKITSLEHINEKLDTLRSLGTSNYILNYFLSFNESDALIESSVDDETESEELRKLLKVQDLLQEIIEKVYISGSKENCNIKYINYGKK